MVFFTYFYIFKNKDIMFIENAFAKNNFFWKYLVGSLIVIMATFAGQLPLAFAIGIKAFQDKKDFKSFTQQQMMTYLDKNLNLFLMLFSFLVGLFALFFVIKKLHNQTILQVTTARKKIDWQRIFFSFVIWAVFSVVSVYIAFVQTPENFVYNFKPLPFLMLFLIAIVLIPIQTSLEEFLFRGYLMQGFGILAKNRWFPLMMTSVIFGSLHLMNPEVDKLGYVMLVYYIGTGLMLGIMTLMDDGMELALGFHAANNLIGCLLLTSDWSALQTNSLLRDIAEPSAGFDVVLPILIVYPILLFIFSKKYGWNNWKEKLSGSINFIKA